jgi:pimeloyl-ACP methyl ester carboxylesterase
LSAGEIERISDNNPVTRQLKRQSHVQLNSRAFCGGPTYRRPADKTYRVRYNTAASRTSPEALGDRSTSSTEAMRIILQLAVLVVVPLTTVTSVGQDKKSQTWYGVLHAGATQLRLQMEFVPDDSGKLSGKMISLDQGNAEIRCDSVRLDDHELFFELKSVGAKFTGKLNESKDQATGTFEQLGAKMPFTLKKVDRIPTQKHLQTWTGLMRAGQKDFDFQFRVFESDDGQSALLDSFSENLFGISCKWRVDDKKVTVEVPIAAAPATFTGNLDDDEQQITGTWKQGIAKLPLVLTAVPLPETRKTEFKRTQMPKPPFDYDVEEVSFKNIVDALSLSGTLTHPKGNGPFAAIILISGSGPQDRDETLMGHKPFLVIADHLTRNGFAVLRYDDRGIGKSTGDFASTTTAGFANDAEAAFEFLKSDKRIAADKIVLCGHSEGGIIAPMIASRRDDVGGCILLAGTGVTGRQISVNQSRLISKAAGLPEHLIAANETMLRRLYERQEQGGEFDATFVSKLADEINQQLPESMRESYDAKMPIDATIGTIQTDWFKFFGSYDPAPALAKTKCPVLVMIGKNDVQVDPLLNLPPIEKALRQGKNPDFELHTLDKLNHLFQTSETGSLQEYSRIEETIAKPALDLITNWLRVRYKQ